MKSPVAERSRLHHGPLHRSGDLFRGIFRAARGAVEIVLRIDRQLRSRYPFQVPSGCRGRDAGIVPLRCARGKDRQGATWLLPQSVMRAAARAADERPYGK